MSDPILTTKLYAPPFPSGWNLVSRLHLIKRLDSALQQRCKLLLISAPAGFGKTTLLSEWVSCLSSRTQPPLPLARMRAKVSSAP